MIIFSSFDSLVHTRKGFACMTICMNVNEAKRVRIVAGDVCYVVSAYPYKKS